MNMLLMKKLSRMAYVLQAEVWTRDVQVCASVKHNLEAIILVWGDSQGGALEEVCEEEDSGSAHAHASQLSHGAVHCAVGQRPAGLPLGLAKHLRPAGAHQCC